MITHKRFSEYFLVLLPIFFVLHGYNENYPLIKAKDVFELLIIYFLVFGTVSALVFILFKSWRKAAVLVLFLMCFHFFFGNVHNALKYLLHDSFPSKYVFFLPFSLLVFIVAFLYLKRTKRNFNRLTRYANVLLLILVLLDVCLFAAKKIKQPPDTPVAVKNVSDCDPCEKPDIYFIIADEYAGKKELADIFHFDNSPFENALKQRGFFIVDSSESNYNYTPHSVASILSMNYLKNIEGRNESQKDRNICYHLINKNATIDLLRLQGYSFKNYSVFTFNNDLPPAYSPLILSGKDLLAAQTFLSRLKYDLEFNLVSTYKIKSEMRRFGNMQLNSLNYLISETASEASKKTSQPRFVYTHLMMPHYPYLFTKDGIRTAPEMILEGSQIRQEDYIGYLQYSNNRFLELIDSILKYSSKPPVIILMGDHGFRHFTTNIPHPYYFMNFNAVYIPSKRYGQFYKGASGVNQFRILFNTLFDQHLPLLKDSTIFLKE